MARPDPLDKRLVLERSSQPPVITYLSNGDYVVWIHFALNFEAGTYLRLARCGKVYREVMEPTGEVRSSVLVADLL